eukprot:scaffold4_cov396-Prasinococcus_capsulatus_cf.AAC.26
MLAVQASAVQPSGPTRGDIKFETLNGAEKLDADFLKLLDIHSSPAKGVSKTKLPYTSNALEALSLEPEFCAKVAGSVVMVRSVVPHLALQSGYISGVRWSRTDPTQLYTCSYDGAVRRLDAHKGIFSEIYFSEEDEYSAFDLASDGNIAFAASNTGDLSVIDVRTNKLARASRSFHDRKINTVSHDQQDSPSACGATKPTPDSNFINRCASGRLGCATNESGRKTSSIISSQQKLSRGNALSSQDAVVVVLTGGVACQAYFAPDGSRRVLTTCYDDHIRIWSDNPKRSAFGVKHNNQTGRWVGALNAGIPGLTRPCPLWTQS